MPKWSQIPRGGPGRPEYPYWPQTPKGQPIEPPNLPPKGPKKPWMKSLPWGGPSRTPPEGPSWAPPGGPYRTPPEGPSWAPPADVDIPDVPRNKGCWNGQTVALFLDPVTMLENVVKAPEKETGIHCTCKNPQLDTCLVFKIHEKKL